MDKRSIVKETFSNLLINFASSLVGHISRDNEWTIKGFVDIFKNVYPVSTDTKVISKILELHLLPDFLEFAEKNGYCVELATHQNWYPDLTFISKENCNIKFALDLKTTYRDELNSDFCNGFTLGSHCAYFVDRDSSKNIQYPYNDYCGHFCLGIIYTREKLKKDFEVNCYTLDELSSIPSVINNFIFFATEKWKIASDKSGSGNTANIGSIKCIKDILAGNGTFAKAGEEIFDDYWANHGKIQVVDKFGKRKPMSSLKEYLEYRGLPADLNNQCLSKRKG